MSIAEPVRLALLGLLILLVQQALTNLMLPDDLGQLTSLELSGNRLTTPLGASVPARPPLRRGGTA